MNAFRAGLVMLLAVMLSGCEAVEMVFKAGVWTGVIMIVVVLGVVGFVAAKLRGPH